MEKDCGMWINILSHMLKKRMNVNTQSLGITGVQSHVMHYILVTVRCFSAMWRRRSA